MESIQVILQVAVILFAGFLSLHLGKKFKTSMYLIAAIFGLLLSFVPSMSLQPYTIYHIAYILIGFQIFRIFAEENYVAGLKGLPRYLMIYVIAAIVICVLALLLQPGIIPAIVLALAVLCFWQDKKKLFPTISLLGVFIALEFVQASLKEVLISILLALGIGVVALIFLLRIIKHSRHALPWFVLLMVFLAMLASESLGGLLPFLLLALGIGFRKALVRNKTRTNHLLEYFFEHTAPFIVIAIALIVMLEPMIYLFGLGLAAVLFAVRCLAPQLKLNPLLSFSLLYLLMPYNPYFASIGFFAVLFSLVLSEFFRLKRSI